MANDPPISAATRHALAEGIRRFDAERFFDAHEAWEDAWRAEQGEVRELLHGLIQIAAGFHKGLVQGRPAGMVKLLTRGLGRVDAAGRTELVTLEPFRSGVASWLEAARAWAAGGARPELPLPKLGTGDRGSP
jgi:predicted metal-dependent hydrolase